MYIGHEDEQVAIDKMISGQIEDLRFQEHAICEECGADLYEDDEKEDGLCTECYIKYARQKADEGRHPDE